MPEGIATHGFVADDKATIAITTATALRQHGYQARAFFSSPEALEAVQFASPDLLLSGIKMPGTSGIDLAVAITSRHPACKVLLISGQAGATHLLDAARQSGHTFDLRSKPIFPGDLLSAVRQKVVGSGASHINPSPLTSSEAQYPVPRIYR